MSALRAATWSSRPVSAVLVVVAAGLLVSGCNRSEPAAADSVYEPAKVGEQTDVGVKEVTFTAKAAARVDLATAVAEPVGEFTVVPYASLIYDGQGVTWVYTNPSPLGFLRAQVVVDHIEGDQVTLADGLAAGTRVVTVGAAEVYGAELEIAGEH